MPHRTHPAVARRDRSLSRIRKLTLSIMGSAAAATLGLGIAFAHALPGHSYTSGSSGRTGPSAAGTVGAAAGAGTAGSRSGLASPASGRGTAAHRQAGTGHGGLTPPKHNPAAAPAQAPAPAPPVVSSGGS
jgi:hypothetical protein